MGLLRGLTFCTNGAYAAPVGRRLAPKAVPYQKADGTTSWRVRIRVNGRQSTETFQNEAAAQVFIHRVLDPNIGPERAVVMRDREDANSSGYVPTLKEALEKHVESLTGVDDRTRADYLGQARRSWLPMLGTLRVDEVDRADIARWVNSATGAPKTVKNAHGVLSGALGWAVLEGHIASNPARGTKLPRKGEEHVEDIHFLTHAEFDLLWAEIPEHGRDLTAWLFGTGMRWSEATAQQRRDVDLDAGMLVDGVWTSAPHTKVARAWKQRPRTLGPPKTKASRRTVLLPQELVPVAERCMKDVGTDAHLFRTSTGQAITHSNWFNRIWKPATIRASICAEHMLDGCKCGTTRPAECPRHTDRDDRGQILPEPCGCAGTLPFRPRIHDARHTHASWLIAQGVRLEVIQERLGHEDYLTTRRIYGHLMPDAQLEASVAASLAFQATRLKLTAKPAPRAPRSLPGRSDQDG